MSFSNNKLNYEGFEYLKNGCENSQKYEWMDAVQCVLVILH